MRNRTEIIKEVTRIVADFEEDYLNARTRKSKRVKKASWEFFKAILHHLTDHGGNNPELIRTIDDVQKDIDSLSEIQEHLMRGEILAMTEKMDHWMDDLQEQHQTLTDLESPQ